MPFIDVLRPSCASIDNVVAIVGLRSPNLKIPSQEVLPMPNWTQEPPDPADHHSFRIVRTPADGLLSGIVTCPIVQGCPTHYYKCRTLPCEGQAKCEACQQGHSWRWHAYISAIMIPSHEHFLFEFTAAASDTFKHYFNHYRTLRACKFSARRPTKKINGRVVIACTRIDEANTPLPEAPDVKKILCHIWGISENRTTIKHGLRHPFASIGVDPKNKNGD